MTSEQNKKLPLLKRKPVIGIKRNPNRRDLYNRRDPDSQKPLQGLSDSDPEVLRRRAALEFDQVAVSTQQTLLDMNPESSLRESLTVLADPEASWSHSDWETITNSGSELDQEGEKAVEEAFIEKVRAGKGRQSNVAAAAARIPTKMQPGTTRDLTEAEAALVLTNMKAGTDLTMEDLRTAREMVDLWDNEDTFQWTVGNVE